MTAPIKWFRNLSNLINPAATSMNFFTIKACGWSQVLLRSQFTVFSEFLLQWFVHVSEPASHNDDSLDVRYTQTAFCSKEYSVREGNRVQLVIQLIFEYKEIVRIVSKPENWQNSYRESESKYVFGVPAIIDKDSNVIVFETRAMSIKGESKLVCIIYIYIVSLCISESV